MACEIISAPGAVFSLWGLPTIPDLQRVGAEVRAVARQAGHSIVYVARIPAGAPAPDSAARQYLNRVLPEFLVSCSSYHVVLEGSGFAAALKRGVLLGLFQLNWAHHKLFVHLEAQQVLKALDERTRPIGAALLELAQREGLLERELS